MASKEQVEAFFSGGVLMEATPGEELAAHKSGDCGGIFLCIYCKMLTPLIDVNRTLLKIGVSEE